MAENTIPLFAGSGKYYVYVYRDPRTGKKQAPIYVGKGTAAHERADVHWIRGARNPLFRSLLEKIKVDGLVPIIEIVAWFDDEAEAFRYERLLIDRFKPRADGGTLCNLLVKGPTGGWTHSLETRERISSALVGKLRGPCPPETAKKIGDAQRGKKRGPNVAQSEKLRGRKLTAEHCAAISRGNMGRRVTPETIEKIRAKNIGRIASTETRMKISRSHVGKTQSDETKEKRSLSLRVSWETDRASQKEELRSRMKDNNCALKGKGVHSDETRKKVSTAIKAWWDKRKAERGTNN